MRVGDECWWLTPVSRWNSKRTTSGGGSSSVPRHVESLSDRRVVQVAAAAGFSAVLTGMHARLLSMEGYWDLDADTPGVMLM